MGDVKRTSKQQDQKIKKDAGKPMISLIPYEFLQGVAEVLGFGVKKYGPYCWTAGMDWSRLMDAAYRHLGAFEKGEDVDDESGLSHLLHLACCVMFLYMHQKLKLGKDDRWKRPTI